jgi:hypothetical protein
VVVGREENRLEDPKDAKTGSKRKTRNLSIRLTPDELKWLEDTAQAEGCPTVSEYTRQVLFCSLTTSTGAKGQWALVALLAKEVREIKQDIGRLWRRLGE